MAKRRRRAHKPRANQGNNVNNDEQKKDEAERDEHGADEASAAEGSDTSAEDVSIDDMPPAPDLEQSEEDETVEGQMTLVKHLAELRSRIIKSLIAVAIGTGVAYYFIEDIMKLIAGEEVSVPEYNFVTGLREYNGRNLRLGDGRILLIEGIHALNPALTSKIPEEAKFRIFINTLTGTLLDDHNMIPTSDNRLLRRIVRDYNKGAFTARQTIAQWKNVCEAEDRWIFPFQETADAMFNSALNIEFAVLRTHAEIILTSVPKNCPEYAEAHRLLKFIRFFLPVSDKEIPPTSIMREFVGGSSFKY